MNLEDFLHLPPEAQAEAWAKLQAELRRKRKYGLYWDDSRHREDVVRRCETEMPILDEVDDRRLHHVPAATDLFDTPDRPQPTHLLIEGDNYHALSVLNYTHRGKVDLIYIDPPYNTGNRDFRYNDNFVDKEDGDRHTKWLSFMHRRLELAKNLLKDTGVIFISIDDNEVAQLKLLCDRVFGEGNFVATVIWQKNFSPKSSAKYFSSNHEYLLCFGRRIDNWEINHLKRTDEQDARYSNPDNDPRGVWTSGDLTARNFYSAGTYSIVTPAGKVVDGPPKGRYWAISKNKFEELVADNRIWFGTDGKASPRLKRFLSDVKEGVVPQTIWSHQEAGNTQEAKKEIIEVFGSEEGFFTTPKPLKLLKRTISIGTKNQDAIILDFFAGSGTTGHAVLEMNKEDNGRRQFILVTNNEVTDKTRNQLLNEGKTEAEIEEQGICRAVTYPRLKKVIEGYTNAKGEKVAGLGGKLRYFQTDFVPAEGSTDQVSYNLRRRCTEMLCFRENVFTPLASTEQYEIFKDHDQVLAILHDQHPQYKNALRDALLSLQSVSDCKLYVFSLDREVNAADYEDFRGVTLENVPAKIIDLYKREVMRLSGVMEES